MSLEATGYLNMEPLEEMQKEKFRVVAA